MSGAAPARGDGPHILQEFLRLESAGGIVLLAFAALAMVIANSPLASLYAGVLDAPIGLGIDPFSIRKPLLLWINDGMMAVFFFLVGLELKREMLDGHLSSPAQVALPAIAAAGGMAGPAAIYAWLNAGDAQAMRGWAIPTATDIAFALGVLALLGNRVPAALKAFLLSVAIFDDLGAIVIIALVYTEGLSATALGTAAAMVVVLAAMNRAGVQRASAYLLVGLPLWVSLLKSGVHATLAGVVLAMFIPLRGSADPPLRRLEHRLHPWVAFGVLPLFALANAGVPVGEVEDASLLHPVFLGVAGGLVAGKLVGVLAGTLAASVLARALGLNALPAGATWPQMTGIALLCGIGFTMSLFIASLAFDQGGGYAGLDRLGILAGSLVSGVLGWLVLRATLPRPAAA